MLNTNAIRSKVFQIHHSLNDTYVTVTWLSATKPHNLNFSPSLVWNISEKQVLIFVVLRFVALFKRWSIFICVYRWAEYGVCLCLQSQDGRFEVRGRHGKSMLTISGVRLSDLGRFDCEALSRIGGHQKSMFLDIECEYVCFLINQTQSMLVGREKNLMLTSKTRP